MIVAMKVPFALSIRSINFHGRVQHPDEEEAGHKSDSTRQQPYSQRDEGA